MNQHLYRLERKKDAYLLATLCFVAYAVSYIGRLNYSAALPEIIASGVAGKTQGGMIATIYFGAYGFGQLVNGVLADRLNPRIQVTAGILGSCVMNLLMAHTVGPEEMYIIWGVNGYAQSLIWAPAFLIVSQSVPAIYQKRALLLLNSAPSAGTILAYLFSSGIMRVASWRSLFLWASVIMACGTMLWLVGCWFLGKRCMPICEQMHEKKERSDRRSGGSWGTLLAAGTGGLILPAMIHGMLKDGVTSWLPTYMTEVFSLPAQTAVMFSVLLPLINLSGAVVAYWMIQRIRNEVACVFVLFAASGGCMVLLMMGAETTPLFSVVLFALVTAAMMGVNVMLCSEVPARFASLGIAGTISGFFNACGYIGTAASMYGIAWVAESYGWGPTRIMWGVSCAVAAGCCMAVIPLWRRQISGKRI